jgi:outer membrane protein OmpA-like peptidoglycan-associated protein
LGADSKQATPTKEEILKALTAPVDNVTTRGFGFRPAVTSGRKDVPTSLHNGDASTAAPAQRHASIDEPILFSLNSADIRPASRTALNDLAEVLLAPQLKDSKILIEGHTDASGSPDRNLTLSQERADAVRDYLVHEGGVPAERLTSVGKGQAEPADPDDPMSPANRRVVLINLNN